MKIKKIEIDGEAIFLKKSKLGWKVVHPIKNEDGTINWFNLFTGGSWFNLIVIAIIVIVILGVLYEYTINIQRFMNCFADPIALENCKAAYSPQNMTLIIP